MKLSTNEMKILANALGVKEAEYGLTDEEFELSVKLYNQIAEEYDLRKRVIQSLDRMESNGYRE